MYNAFRPGHNATFYWDIVRNELQRVHAWNVSSSGAENIYNSYMLCTQILELRNRFFVSLSLFTIQ